MTQSQPEGRVSYVALGTYLQSATRPVREAQ